MYTINYMYVCGASIAKQQPREHTGDPSPYGVFKQCGQRIPSAQLPRLSLTLPYPILPDNTSQPTLLTHPSKPNQSSYTARQARKCQRVKGLSAVPVCRACGPCLCASMIFRFCKQSRVHAKLNWLK